MADDELVRRVDEYLESRFVAHDRILAESLAAASTAGLPPIQVSPLQGKFLHLLAKSHGARRILEVGTLGGYSTIWLARALPSGGRLVTLEVDPRHAEVARANFARAHVEHLVDLRLGPALDSLPKLAAELGGPFDFVFLDADKPNNAAYFDWAVKLGRPGTVIVVDNVVRKGAVAQPGSGDGNVEGTRRMNDQVAADPRVDATTIQTVGSKGHDGFLLAVVRDR
jgi:predicted O-methyltransferase YrrM